MTDNGGKREMTFEEEWLAYIVKINKLLFNEDEYPGDSLLKSVLRDSKRIFHKAAAKIEALQMDKEQLKSDIVNANMNCEHLQAENKFLLTKFTRINEEIAQPYLLINTDAELTAKMIETIKKQKLVIVPGDEATVEFLDKASIRAAAVKEFAEILKKKYSQADILCPRRIVSLLEKDLDNLVKEMAGDNNA